MDTTKLPKWAQQHISILESKIDHLKNENDVLSGKKKSHVEWVDVVDNSAHGLPEHTTIRMHMLSGYIDFRFYPTNNRVQVYSSWGGTYSVSTSNQPH